MIANVSYCFNLTCSSGGDRDELAAAGAWMYKVTKEQQYLDDAENAYLAGTAWGFNWNDDNVGAAVSIRINKLKCLV